MIKIEDCRAMDRADELASLRDCFDLPAGIIYLDGNSLGAMPKAAPKKADDVIRREWGKDLIGSWNSASWWDLPVILGDKMAPLIGAARGETVVTDSTSVNLYKVLSNAIRIQKKNYPAKKVILAERENFPSDLYMIEGFIELINEGYELVLIDNPEELEQKLNQNTAVALLAQVNYRSGYLYELAETTRLVHSLGALVVWDLCHSIGALPIDLKTADADFAVGCTYKYLNGGPGSPAMLWANPKHKNDFWQPLSGWWGHSEPFRMKSSFEGAKDIRRFLCGTQPIVSMALVHSSLDIFLKTDMQKLRAKSLSLTDLFIALVEQECTGHPLGLATPREHKNRGSHVSFTHPEGYAIVQALIARGVVGDYREPQIMRFGVAPLYLSHEDIWNAVQHLKTVLGSREWDNEKFKARSQVT